MVDYIIPALFLLLFAFAAFRKIPVYDKFVEGAKGAANVCISAFPYLAATLIMVQLFRLSGAAAAAARFLAPGLEFIGIPRELSELILLRPFTGSGSTALVNDIMSKYGADSYVERCAAVVAGSSDTVFYVASIYFGGTKVKRLKYAIPVALLVTVFSSALSCWLCKVM
ncbi:spore maturation protein [Clostridia bacterium]|nr:spore maturation protein [Clostridia bacterium]